jgi:prevent-host-death family protein
MTWYIRFMKTMIISEFKAKCIGVMKKTALTKEPVLVTLRGKPLAIVTSVDKSPEKPRILGALAGSMRITGDIVHSDFAEDWD